MGSLGIIKIVLKMKNKPFIYYHLHACYHRISEKSNEQVFWFFCISAFMRPILMHVTRYDFREI